MVLKPEKITNPKKFSLMLSGSLNCLEISLGIFTSNRYTMQLLKQSNMHVSKSHANNIAEFPNMHSAKIVLLKASRMSNKEIIYFYFPQRMLLLFYHINIQHRIGMIFPIILYNIRN